MPGSDLRAWAFALWALASPVLADAPGRVVSMNLCADQLAMLLAGPGQLVSISFLASDPRVSPMVAQAAAYPANRGGAEQVYLLRPDLVLAGTYTSAASVDLLTGLGVRVERLPIVSSLAEVSAQIRDVGALLGRQDQAQALAQQFEDDLAALPRFDRAATAALYYPNGYTTGAGTLANEVLERTGFANIGAGAGLTGGGILPLERLVMAQPELIVTSTPYPGASRAEEILTHPALDAVRATSGQALASDADWVCGTPYLMRALRGMVAARQGLAP